VTALRALTTAVAVLALGCGIAVAQAPRLDGVRIELRPNPRVVPADGQTAAIVRAELRDNRNLPVADGTNVVFRIEGGSLDAGGGERRPAITVQTSGGAATVWATSTTVGTATVVAEVLSGQGRNQVQIYFTEEGAAELAEARVVQVRGGWVGYGYELNMVEARTGQRGPAEVTFGALAVTAEVIQVDVGSLILKASEAIVSSGEHAISGSDLYYDLMSGRGAVRRLSEAGVERLCFDCYTMQAGPLTDELPEDAFQLSREEAPTWAIARSMSIFPYEKVVLRNASLYVESRRILRLPKYWLIGMPGYMGTTHSQVLSVNSDGGIGFDFPYVYDVTDTTTGSVKVQRGAANGTVIARDYWSLALEEAYETGSADGALTVAGLPRDDWGVEWRDSRDLGPRTESHVTAYSPDHRSAYMDASVYEWAQDHRLNLRGYYDRPQGLGDSYGASADWLTYNRPLGKWAASYRVGTGIGMGHVDGIDEGVVGEHQVYAALDLPRARVGERTTLRPSVSNLFVWDTSGYRYESVRGELAMRSVVSSNASVGLAYQAQYTSGDDGRGYEHLLNLDASAYRGALWQSYLTATYELDDSNTYAYWLLDYFPDERWRIGLGATYYDYQGDAYDDLEVTVARRLGGREIGLRWSADSDAISLELGGFGGFMSF